MFKLNQTLSDNLIKTIDLLKSTSDVDQQSILDRYTINIKSINSSVDSEDELSVDSKDELSTDSKDELSKQKIDISFNVNFCSKNKFNPLDILAYIQGANALQMYEFEECLINWLDQILNLNITNSESFSKYFSVEMNIIIDGKSWYEIQHKFINNINDVIKSFYHSFISDIDPLINSCIKDLENQQNQPNKPNRLLNLLKEYKSIRPFDKINSTKEVEPTIQLKPINQINKKCHTELYLLNKHTYNLLELIDWSHSNAIMSGGLLYEILQLAKPDQLDKPDELHKLDKLFKSDELHKLKQTKLDQLNQLTDIDIFLFGDNLAKEQMIKQTIRNIYQKYPVSDVVVGMNRSLVYIFIKGIPRLIQIVCTKFNSAKEIVDDFDFTYLTSYYEGNGKRLSKSNDLYNSECKINPNKYPNNDHTNLNWLNASRIYKSAKRGLDISNILKYKNILNHYDLKRISKQQQQIQYYSSTENLTSRFSFDANMLYNLFSLRELDYSQLNYVGDFNTYNMNNNNLSNNLPDIELKVSKHSRTFLNGIYDKQFNVLLRAKVLKIFDNRSSTFSSPNVCIIQIIDLDQANQIINIINKIKERMTILANDNKVFLSRSTLKRPKPIEYSIGFIQSKSFDRKILNLSDQFTETNANSDEDDNTQNMYKNYDGLILKIKEGADQDNKLFRSKLNVSVEYNMRIWLKTWIMKDHNKIGLKMDLMEII